MRILVSPDRGDAPQGQRGSWRESCTVVSIFYCMSRVAEHQSLPCVKGGGVRKDTGGIDAEQFTFCNANSDYSMSENRTAHNRKPHTNSSRWGTIPQTLLTQGQPPLHKGALVRCAAERAGEDCECIAKGTDCHASDIGHWLAMTRGKIADAA